MYSATVDHKPRGDCAQGAKQSCAWIVNSSPLPHESSGLLHYQGLFVDLDSMNSVGEGKASRPVYVIKQGPAG